MKKMLNSLILWFAIVRFFKKLCLWLIISAVPALLVAQEMTQNATSIGAGIVSGGNYTGYASVGQVATYLYSNGSAIATQGIILNEISATVEFTFELSGTLTENETLKSGSLRIKSGAAVTTGPPLAFVNVYLIDEETETVLFDTQTDKNGFFQFLKIPYKNYYFALNEPIIPAEPVLLTLKSNIFIKKVEVSGEVGTAGITTSVTVTPVNACTPDNPNYKIWYFDNDKDGFGSSLISVGQCTQPVGYVANNLDCNDKNATIHPNATDVPGSGIDANCDGFFTWYTDTDNDGYGSEIITASLNRSPGIGESADNTDCDDTNADINPGARDFGGLDLNCNGIVECTGISNLVFDAPIDPVEVTQGVLLTVHFDGNNPISAVLDWGDGTETAAQISEGLISGSHSYTTAGVYSIEITITDDCGFIESHTYKYIVIYDPSSGFVTGSGLISSPLGASAMYPNATGLASFGFVSKYDKNKLVPKGNTEFEFDAGNLQFKSTEYEWLVVAGAKAKFKGRGTVNGIPGFQFMISAIDGDVKTKGDPDLFRIKIWNEETGEVVYDNELNSEIDADPTTIILEGSIKIHTPKTKSALASSSSDLDVSEESYFVYPNPTKGKSIVTGFRNGTVYTLKISDNLGKTTLIKKIVGTEVEIDLSGYPSGLYNITILNNSISRSLRIIKD